MDILSDNEIKIGLNDLLNSAHHPIVSLYNRMFSLGFSPKDEMSTLIYSIGIFTVKYNRHIKNHDVDDAIKLSYNDVLQNKIISSFIARKTMNTIDKAAGVK